MFSKNLVNATVNPFLIDPSANTSQSAIIIVLSKEFNFSQGFKNIIVLKESK